MDVAGGPGYLGSYMLLPRAGLREVYVPVFTLLRQTLVISLGLTLNQFILFHEPIKILFPNQISC